MAPPKLSDEELARRRVERFWSKVSKKGLRRLHMKTRCWPWTAGKLKSGYGQFRWADGDNKRAHRVAWYYTYGVWPSETLDHRCLNPVCCRPSHCRDVSNAVNVSLIAKRGRHYNQKKRVCPAGHKYDLIKRRGNGKAFRACSQCSNESKRRSRYATAA